jgi:hypothetical protein
VVMRSLIPRSWAPAASRTHQIPLAPVLAWAPAEPESVASLRHACPRKGRGANESATRLPSAFQL